MTKPLKIVQSLLRNILGVIGNKKDSDRQNQIFSNSALFLIGAFTSILKVSNQTPRQHLYLQMNFLKFRPSIAHDHRNPSFSVRFFICFNCDLGHQLWISKNNATYVGCGIGI
jgi:hypothetical protein